MRNISFRDALSIKNSYRVAPDSQSLYCTCTYYIPVELAMIMDRLYGGVCYAGIDTDPELKYPKGAGRVAFSNQQSYIAAISARFVQLQHGDIDKRVSIFKIVNKSLQHLLF